MFCWRNALLNIKRHKRKSLLITAICILIVFFVCVYINNIETSKKQLADLPNAIPVTANISNLIGSLDKVQSAGQQTGPSSPQVRLELQADCFAGVWLANAAEDPTSPIEAITKDDLDRAVDAARAVGDDRIQQSATGEVSPESWTHGSSEQRQYWLNRGYASGNPDQCDTFADGALGKA